MAEKGKLGKISFCPLMHGNAWNLSSDLLIDPTHSLKPHIDPVIGRDEEIRRTIEGKNDISFHNRI